MLLSLRGRQPPFGLNSNQYLIKTWYFYTNSFIRKSNTYLGQGFHVSTMADCVMYNNGLLYPDPTGPLLGFLRKIIEERCLRFGMSSLVDVDRNESVLKVEMNVRFGLENLQRMCEGTNCCHDMWWVSGGAAAYITGKTNSFNDIDLFVNCVGFLDIGLVSRSPTILSVSIKGQVVTLSTVKGFVQIIPVRFTLGFSREEMLSSINLTAINDCMAAYFCAAFDLPETRVAVKFDELRRYNCLDFSAFKFVQFPTSLRRLAGYAVRKIGCNLNPLIPTLPQCVIFKTICSLTQGQKLVLTDDEVDFIGQETLAKSLEMNVRGRNALFRMLDESLHRRRAEQELLDMQWAEECESYGHSSEEENVILLGHE